MSARSICIWAALAVSLLLDHPTRSHAQGTVYFGIPPLFDVRCGDFLIRGPDGSLAGTNYVAQLYYGPSASSLVAHTSQPARFRPGTSGPGTWLGGTRTLTGLAPGQLAVLSVRVWDVRSGSTYEQAAVRVDNGPFYYQVPTDPTLGPTNYWMLNFRAKAYVIEGFIDGCDTLTNGTPTFHLQPQSRTVGRGDTVTFTVDLTNACLGHWRFNGNVIDLSKPCHDARTLLLTNVQPGHAGPYQFIAENYTGSVTSEVALLTVLSPPQLTAVHAGQGAFAFYVSESSRPVVIETAADLNPATTWNPVFTNTAPFWFTNSAPADRQRFYRTVFR